MISDQYYTLVRPLFAVNLARKDIGYALQYAEQTGVQLHSARTADAHLIHVKDRDRETGDGSRSGHSRCNAPGSRSHKRKSGSGQRKTTEHER